MVIMRPGSSSLWAVSVIILGGALAGCGLLPASAPTASQLEATNSDSGLPYTLVNVDKRVVDILRGYRHGSFGSGFTRRGYVPGDVLGVGDFIAITIYESGGSSIFGATPAPAAPATTGVPMPAVPNTPGSASSIPPQVIEADGTVLMPYVGRIKAAGKTPAHLSAEIQKQLQGKAVEPQVIVTLVSNATNTATVGGDVASPRPVALSLRGERLLDVIAAAGGAKYPAYEVYVSVVRGKQMGTVLLQTIVTNPSENIYVRPNDQIFLTRYPRTFAVLGATAKVSQYTFDTPTVTLVEAVARAGGPIDTIGDPAGIYLFRYEPLSVADKILNKDEISAAVSAVKSEGNKADFVPLLYRVDLRGAEGYFLSQNIAMQDKDVVLVTNAEATQIQKLLTGVRGFTGIAYDLSRQAGG